MIPAAKSGGCCKLLKMREGSRGAADPAKGFRFKVGALGRHFHTEKLFLERYLQVENESLRGQLTRFLLC
jgi:hypothetical protein